MQYIAIIAASIFAAVIYGILHDQFTAHICVEYFSVAHPPVFPTENPTLLAFGWGVIATWWVGLILGVPLAYAARFGRAPRRDLRSLIRPIATLLAVMGIAAALAGTTGWYLAMSHRLYIPSIENFVSDSKRDAFMFDVWAHNTSYLIGFVGGCVVIVRVWWSRQRAAKPPQLPT